MCPAKAHYAFEPPPNPTAVIWRYLDFTKFVSLLATRSLWFSRADLLGDPFEGSITRLTLEARNALYDQLGVQKNHPRDLSWILRNARQWVYLNCWHVNDHESAAMWRLYSKSAEAVAVRSRYDRLHRCLPDGCYLGVVKYVDYETDKVPDSNLFFPYLHKRRSFQHETEVRAIISDLPHGEEYDKRMSEGNPARGRLVPVDIATLIDAVYVAPQADDWYYDLVREVTAKYDLPTPVTRSALDASPLY